MDGNGTRETVRRRWTRGPRGAHNRETITLADSPDGTWTVRRYGPYGGTSRHPNQSLALAAIARMIGNAWLEHQVRTSLRTVETAAHTR